MVLYSHFWGKFIYWWLRTFGQLNIGHRCYYHQCSLFDRNREYAEIRTNQRFARPPSKSGQSSSRLDIVLRISVYIQPDFSPICGDEKEEISLGPNVGKKWAQNLCKGLALTTNE